MNNIKYAVIGGGSMGSRRIRHLKELTSGQVYCYDLREDRRNEINK